MSDTIAEAKAALATSVTKLLAQFADVSGQQKDASEALQNASAATNSKREELLRSAAKIAFAGNVEADLIDGAVEAALLARNEQKTEATIKTFASQLRLAMHPDVRKVLPSIFDLGTAAWDDEQAVLKDDKDAPTPLKTAFARRTHMLITLLRNVREHGASFPSKASIVQFGIASDPAKDDEKIAGKLKRLRAQFDAFHAEFPLEAFKSINTYLAKIDARKLREARDIARKAETPKPQDNLRKADPAPASDAPASDAPSDIIGDAIDAFNAA